MFLLDTGSALFEECNQRCLWKSSLPDCSEGHVSVFPDEILFLFLHSSVSLILARKSKFLCNINSSQISFNDFPFLPNWILISTVKMSPRFSCIFLFSLSITPYFVLGTPSGWDCSESPEWIACSLLPFYNFSSTIALYCLDSSISELTYNAPSSGKPFFSLSILWPHAELCHGTFYFSKLSHCVIIVVLSFQIELSIFTWYWGSFIHC